MKKKEKRSNGQWRVSEHRGTSGTAAEKEAVGEEGVIGMGRGEEREGGRRRTGVVLVNNSLQRRSLSRLARSPLPGPFPLLPPSLPSNPQSIDYARLIHRIASHRHTFP